MSVRRSGYREVVMTERTRDIGGVEIAGSALTWPDTRRVLSATSGLAMSVLQGRFTVCFD